MPTNERICLLLDLDGVILDLAEAERETNRLVGTAFTLHLGGDYDAWAENQHRLWLDVWRKGCLEYKEDPGLRGLNLSRWWDRLYAQWIVGLCRTVGVDSPATFEECVDVAERVLSYMYERTGAVVPGAREVIETLSGDFDIHMASGNPAWIVEAALKRVGVRDLIGKPFGCDLIGFQKMHSRFYPAIVEAVRATPSRTIVVDDGDDALAAAERAGLKIVKVGQTQSGQSGTAIKSLAELPDVVSQVL